VRNAATEETGGIQHTDSIVLCWDQCSHLRNTSMWNFMYLFRNWTQVQCQPQLVTAVHIFPSGLKLFLH